MRPRHREVYAEPFWKVRDFERPPGTAREQFEWMQEERAGGNLMKHDNDRLGDNMEEQGTKRWKGRIRVKFLGCARVYVGLDSILTGGKRSNDYRE